MTWTIKHTPRGGPMLADYECPVHGRFEALVDRDDQGNPPSHTGCEHEIALDDDEGYDQIYACDERSPWRISAPAVHTQFVVSATQGKPAPKPHADAMDTRLLAEGQRKKFRVQRKSVRERLRQQRMKEYLR